MEKTKKPMTWKQLKRFANQLTPKQLKRPVQWWGDERGGTVKSAFEMAEDYCTTDNGVEPVSVQEYEEGDDRFPITYPEGTPMLEVD